MAAEGRVVAVPSPSPVRRWRVLGVDTGPFISGSVGGVCGAFVGHPFDTVKVRMQMTQGKSLPAGVVPFRGSLHCTLETVRLEGMRGLFRGVASPLAAALVFNSVLFGVYEDLRMRLTDSSGHLSAPRFVVTCMTAGAAEALTETPFELVKVRVQARGYAGAVGASRSRSTLREAVQIARGEGVVGLFRGLWPTLLRECIGNVVYFAVYESLKAALMRRRPAGESVPVAEALLAGGLAGQAYWLTIYPIDSVKSRLQCDEVGRFRGTLHCIRVTLAESGVRGLYRGIAPALCRAFPTNGACFAGYEVCKRFFYDADQAAAAA